MTPASASIPSPRAPSDPVHVLYVTTERWVDFSKQEGVPVLLAYRQRYLEAQGVRVSWARYQRLIPFIPRRGWLREVFGKLWEPASTLLDAWHVLRGAAPMMKTVDIVTEWYSLYGVAGLLLSKLYRKPMLFEVDALLVEEYSILQKAKLGRWRTNWARRFFRANLNHACRVIARSEVMAKVLREQWNVPAEKIAVIPCALEIEKFPEVPPLNGNGAPQVVFMGSLQPWHGCELLIEAFALVIQRGVKARLVIIGDGKQRAQLVVRCAQLDLSPHVRFIGAVPHDRIPGLLQEAAVNVAPYPVLPVPFYFSPLKIFEYLGAGRAIVASRLGQMADILKDGENALLVQPGNVEQLADAIQQLIADPALRDRLGRNARALAADYTYERQAERWRSIYAGILAQTEKEKPQ